MHKQFSIAEAKNKLPAIIHSVEKGSAVELTRRGKPVAMVMSTGEYERLTRRKEGFWRALTKFRENLPPEEDAVTDADFEGLRDDSEGRKVDLLK